MNLIPAILLFFSWPFSSNQEAIREITSIKEQMKGYYSSNLDSAAILAEMILDKSKESGYKLGEAKGKFAIAYVAYKQGKTSKAIPYFLEALNLYQPLKTNEASTDKAYICLTLGKIYRQHYSIPKALDFYGQGIAFAKAANDKVVLRKLLYNQSVAYRNQGDLIQAMDALTRSMDLIPEGDKVVKQRTYNQFGLIYRDLGEYQEARNWYQKMIYLDTLNASRYKGQACHNMATTYREQNVHSKAQEYYIKALSAFENYGEPKDFFLTYNDMAELALLQRKHPQASEYAQKALTLIDQVPNTPNYYSIYKILSQCATNQKPLEAIAYANQYIESSEAFGNQQSELVASGDRYKVELIASNYFDKTKRLENRIKMAWTMSCAAAFIFLAVILSFKLYRIYSYRSPQLALSHIKNQNEMIYLLDLFRKEKEEMKNTLRQKE